jgi:hypothetical protein
MGLGLLLLRYAGFISYGNLSALLLGRFSVGPAEGKDQGKERKRKGKERPRHTR